MGAVRAAPMLLLSMLYAESLGKFIDSCQKPSCIGFLVKGGRITSGTGPRTRFRPDTLLVPD
jgi:hypothetical protein